MTCRSTTSIRQVGDVVLTYKDGGGGETVLRRVAFEDVRPGGGEHHAGGAWTISGYKWNVTEDGQVIGPLEGVVIRLTKTEGNIDFPTDGMITTTDETGYYSFSVPEFEATYSLDGGDRT